MKKYKSTIEKYAFIDDLVFEDEVIEREKSIENKEVIYLTDILDYINRMEPVPYKLVSSEELKVKDEYGFKLIVPEALQLKQVRMAETMIINGKLKGVFGSLNALEGPHVLLFNNMLYSKDNPYDCVGIEDFDNGLVIFDGFENIPFVVHYTEITEGLTLKGE